MIMTTTTIKAVDNIAAAMQAISASVATADASLDVTPVLYGPASTEPTGSRASGQWQCVVRSVSLPSGTTLAGLLDWLNQCPGKGGIVPPRGGRGYSYLRGDYSARTWLTASTLGHDKGLGLVPVVMPLSAYLASVDSESELASLLRHDRDVASAIESGISHDSIAVITYHATVCDAEHLPALQASLHDARSKAEAHAKDAGTKAGPAVRQALLAARNAHAREHGMTLRSTGETVSLAVHVGETGKSKPASKQASKQASKPASK